DKDGSSPRERMSGHETFDRGAFVEARELDLKYEMSGGQLERQVAPPADEALQRGAHLDRCRIRKTIVNGEAEPLVFSDGPREFGKHSLQFLPDLIRQLLLRQ